MADNLKFLMRTAEKEIKEMYSEYIAAFERKGITLLTKAKKVSYIKGIVTISVYFYLVPQETNQHSAKHWKYFAQKVITVRRYHNRQCKAIYYHKTNIILNMFLRYNLFLSSKKKVEQVCLENLGNVLLRIIYFSRFNHFPNTYRGKDFSVVLLLFLLLFLAITILTSRNWYAWY